MADWALSTDHSLSDRQLDSGAQIYFASDASRELEVIGATAPAYGDVPLLVPLLHTWCQKIMASITLLLYGASWVYLWLWWALVVHDSRASKPGLPPLPPGVLPPPHPPSAPLEGWTALDMLLTFVWAMLTYESLLACMLLLRAKKPNPDLPSDPSLRVAMIVTRAPSEPFSVVQTTLEAMLQQDYVASYHVWLADESPTEEIVDWCYDHGVHISTRFEIEEYHQKIWPRRTRCKEGNLAYFYDHYGYDNYDIVAQFDADHVPSVNYLTTCLKGFADPQVGYVAAPSICAENRRSSWAARGRLYFESSFHGVVQLSYTRTWMPCCIGSHYTVRTAHLKASGGIGPELDEDFSTSLLMTCHGYKGVFSIDTMAIGAGPDTFQDSMKQEYQWARSFVLLTMCYVFRFWSRRLTLRESFRILQCCSFYVYQAILVAVLMATVLLSATLLSFGPTTWLEVFVHFYVTIVAGSSQWLFLQSHGWLRPNNVPMLSVELMLHVAARPWYIFRGVLDAVISQCFGFQMNIKVTPKGPQGERLMGVSATAPFAVSACICLFACMFGTKAIQIPLVTAIGFLILMIGIVVMHYIDHHNWRKLPWVNLLQHTLVIGSVTGFLLTVSLLRRKLLRVLFVTMFSIKHHSRSPWNDTKLLVLMYIIAASWLSISFVWWLTRLIVNKRAARHAETSTPSGQTQEMVSV